MDGEASEAEEMSLFRSVSRLMTNRKIENAALLLNPLARRLVRRSLGEDGSAQREAG